MWRILIVLVLVLMAGCSDPYPIPWADLDLESDVIDSDQPSQDIGRDPGFDPGRDLSFDLGRDEEADAGNEDVQDVIEDEGETDSADSEEPDADDTADDTDEGTDDNAVTDTNDDGDAEEPEDVADAGDVSEYGTGDCYSVYLCWLAGCLVPPLRDVYPNIEECRVDYCIPHGDQEARELLAAILECEQSGPGADCSEVIRACNDDKGGVWE